MLENGASCGNGVRCSNQNHIRFFSKMMSASPAISEKTLVLVRAGSRRIKHFVDPDKHSP